MSSNQDLINSMDDSTKQSSCSEGDVKLIDPIIGDEETKTLQTPGKIESISIRDTKVTVRFRPIGSTPSINPKIFKISGSSTVNVLIRFICNKLNLQTVNLYITNSFQPNPDESVGDLFDLFNTNNELIINYCNSIAFG